MVVSREVPRVLKASMEILWWHKFSFCVIRIGNITLRGRHIWLRIIFTVWINRNYLHDRKGCIVLGLGKIRAVLCCFLWKWKQLFGASLGGWFILLLFPKLWLKMREKSQLAMFCLQLLFVDCKHVNGRLFPVAERKPSSAPFPGQKAHGQNAVRESPTCFHK